MKSRIENNLPWVFPEGQICEEHHMATVDMRREVGTSFYFYHFHKSLPCLFLLKCFKIKGRKRHILKETMTQSDGMVFLSPQIYLQVSSRALSTDPGGLHQCGKHCHLLGLLRMSVDSASQTQSWSRKCQHLSHQSCLFQWLPGGITQLPRI